LKDFQNVQGATLCCLVRSIWLEDYFVVSVVAGVEYRGSWGNKLYRCTRKPCLHSRLLQQNALQWIFEVDQGTNFFAVMDPASVF